MMLVALFLAGCGPGSDTANLSEEEAAIAASAGIDAETAREIRRHGHSLSRLQGISDDWEYYDADGVVLETAKNQGESTLETLRSRLDNDRYAAYLLDQAYGFGPDLIAVVPDTDPYAYLAIVKTNGVNYDVEYADVIERYKAWDAHYGLRLVGAGMDWMYAEFDRPPQDWDAFAEEVYEFCPDVVEQGTGSVDALSEELRKAAGVYLWWD